MKITKPLDILVVQNSKDTLSELDKSRCSGRKFSNNLFYTTDPVYALNRIDEEGADIVITENRLSEPIAAYNYEGVNFAEKIRNLDSDIWVFRYSGEIYYKDKNIIGYMHKIESKEDSLSAPLLAVAELLDSKELASCYHKRDFYNLKKAFPFIKDRNEMDGIMQNLYKNQTPLHFL
jgi:hypothetical protein